MLGAPRAVRDPRLRRADRARPDADRRRHRAPDASSSCSPAWCSRSRSPSASAASDWAAELLERWWPRTRRDRAIRLTRSGDDLPRTLRRRAASHRSELTTDRSPPSGPGARIRSARPGTAKASTSRCSREHAEKVELCLFDASGRREVQRIALPEHTDQVWHCYLPEARPGLLYGYRVHGPYEPERGPPLQSAQAAARPVRQATSSGELQLERRATSATRIGHRARRPVVRPARQRRAACPSAA